VWLDWGKKGPDNRSVFNVGLFLDFVGISVRFNEFTDRIEIQGLEGYTELTDNAESRIWDMMQKVNLRVTKDFLFSSLNAIAGYNSYHPVRDYFDGLTWDKVPRLDTWLSDYCGIADTPYTRCVGAKTMLATVRRIRRPGTKFDQMAVLEGIQGTGKSTLLRVLAVKDEWFTDAMALTLDNKQIVEQSQGKMLIEVPELQKMRNAELEQVKATLSRQVDRARGAYKRRSEDVPRQFIL
jgi:predicted P-loop ATPase